MTIRVSSTPQRHIAPQPVHTFSIPVVRELPQAPAEPGSDRGW